MTWLTQSRVCTMAAAVLAILTLVLFFIPDLVFWLFAMERDAGGVIISRRAAAIFIGLAYLAWAVRNAPYAPALATVFRAFALLMAALALVGSFEFVSGGVGAGIFLAVGTEAFFALAFWRLSRG